MKPIRNLAPILFLAITILLPACSSLFTPPLFKAVYTVETAEVKRLLAEGADVNVADKNGVTPLIIAAARDEEIVRDLLQKGADVNAATTVSFKHKGEIIVQGVTPLMTALAKKKPKIADMLLQHGADVNKKTVNGSTALMIATGNEDPEMVRTLLKKGADPNVAITTAFEFEGETVQAGSTALMAALAKKQSENARILIENGADVNAKTENGVAALTIAAVAGDHLSVKALLDKGADPKAKTTKDFVSKGMPVFEGGDAMLAAGDGGNAECLRLLIEAGGDVNSANTVGATPLMAAATKGHLEAVKFLVEHGADVNGKTTKKFMIGKNPVPKGSSVLSGAVYKGHKAVVRYLVDHGANVNIHDDDYGMDPLYLACMKGYLEISKILVDGGTDVFYINKRGDTAYGVAYHNNYYKIAKYINDARTKAKTKQASKAEK